MGSREVKESPVTRGVAETYNYTFTLTNLVPSGTYANAANALYSVDSNGRTYTTAVAGWEGAGVTVSATTFTTSTFAADVLTHGNRYRLNCSMTIDGDTWDWNLYIDARE